uniref:Zinc finger, CCHC-type n=1 Tax=Tanacetum cinerariifolium TaxID=118510 RepID=A0A6L2JZN4_TANCI|nr:zinc finger, CCHC-type [Tanacetum cinerariifolium]
MSDSLFDVYTNVKSAKELWDSLESKYMAEDSSSKKFLKCGKTRHFKRDCRSGKKNNANVGGSKKGLRTNPKTKWIDSGATTHVCKDYCWFKTFEPVEDGSVLYIGHIHYKRMLKMSKDELIPAIDENSDKCTTSPYKPQQNGVAERKNRALKEMGCRAIVRLLDPKRKTLGEKGIDCIFVGYVEHSKAYRFYVIEPNESFSINSNIESRDAIFDENRFYSIPRPKDIIPNLDESQRDDHSDDVPSETSEPRKEIKLDHNTHIVILLRKILEPIMKLHNLGILLSGKKQLMMRLQMNLQKEDECDETIDKFKARLVIQDFRQKEGINYFNTYAPVARITNIRLLLALAAIHNLVIQQMDVKTTFLNGDLDEKVQHWKAITRIFKYLRGTKDYGLSYVGYPSVLEGYSDASWINHVEDSSSTSGWVFLFGGCAISWASKKQTCSTGSIMESEFVALVAAGQEAELLRNLIHEIPIWPKPIAPISI